MAAEIGPFKRDESRGPGVAGPGVSAGAETPEEVHGHNLIGVLTSLATPLCRTALELLQNHWPGAGSSSARRLPSMNPVMSWFKIADRRLRFRGRITRQPVVEWLASGDGTAAVQAAASQIRFALFGRTRTARRRMRRELWEAVSAPAARASIGAECEPYLTAWAELAYAPSLPRATVDLHRLVVVPRTMILARTLSRATVRLGRVSGDRGVSRIPAFRAFLARRVLSEMDEAIRRAAPAPNRPVYAHESWACVALDSEFEWIDPMWSGPDWRGHVMLFEMPSARLQRRQRRELEAAIERLKQTLPKLSRQQRDGTVQVAMDGMTLLRV